MLKKYIIPFLTIFIFSACSLKMPTFELPSFLSFKEDYSKILTEANVCQVLESDNDKLSCYKKIEAKNSFAQIRLGTYYADKKDYSSALKYLNQAKNNKNIYANLPLAFLYYKGEGVSKDISKSFELLEDSSSIDPIAAYQLSRFYLQGINTKIDVSKGISLLEFAASKNLLVAQQMLVNIYSNGLFSVEKDAKKVKIYEDMIKKDIRDSNFDIYKI